MPDSAECAEGETCVDGTCQGETIPLSEPVIFVVNPSSGSYAGGTEIAILGDVFEEGASVNLGGSACQDVTVVGAGEIQCTTPAASPATVDVTVDQSGWRKSPVSGWLHLHGRGTSSHGTHDQRGLPGVIAPASEASVELQGWILEDLASISVDGVEVDWAWENGKAIFAAPAMEFGASAAVSATLTDGTALTSPLPSSLRTCRNSQRDGVFSPGEWPAYTEVATNAVPTAWGPGLNELGAVYAMYDETHLHLAFSATVEGADGTPQTH